MIITEIGRGLGNSMYVYAAALALAKHLNTELKLDTSYLKSWPSWKEDGGLWEFELGKFNISAKEATKDEIRKFVVKTTFRPVDKIIRKYKLFDRHVVYFPSHGSTEDFFNIPNNSYLRGYLGREKFFRGIKEQIKKEFTLKDEYKGRIANLLNEIKNCNSVSIHVRRGTDMFALKNGYILDADYYRRAVEFIRKKVKNPVFYVFTDNLKWCQENLNFGVKLNFADNGNLGGYELLEVLRNCKYNILANSALSWWAGYLNENPDKIIISPARFTQFTNANVDEDVTPKDWVKL